MRPGAHKEPGPPRVRFAPAMKTVKLYAIEGESVFCERQHFVGLITRDIVWGERTCGDEVSGKFALPGEQWPTCKCGALFAKGGQIRFRKGYR